MVKIKAKKIENVPRWEHSRVSIVSKYVNNFSKRINQFNTLLALNLCRILSELSDFRFRIGEKYWLKLNAERRIRL